MTPTADRSEALFRRAERVIPGGVNSPVRAYRAVGGTPRFVASGSGAEIVDADGRRRIDLVQSWGALLFGHAREEIVRAAADAVTRGSSFGSPTEAEVILAERIVAMVPSVETVRLVSSGTEAAMSAVRVARGCTGRPMVIAFDGCYHGHSDSLLAAGGSGVATLSLPGSAGVTAGAVQDTIVLPYNDVDAVRAAFERFGDRVACVIVEPVAANMGVIPPADGFLEALRDRSAEAGALLVFDEVITGFRLGRGGAQERFGILPDLTVLGKVMGGGFPCAAFGGRRDVMEQLAPVGPVYQAGTLSGNPVAVAAGLAALELIERLDPYPALEAAAHRLTAGLAGAFAAAGVEHAINRVGSLFSVFFGPGSVTVTDRASAGSADHRAYAGFFHGMLERGVALPPSGYEAWFLSTAHDDAVVDRVVEAAASTARVGLAT